MSVENITLALVAVINAVIVWVIASQSWRNRINLYFITAASFVIIWALGTLLLIAGTTPELASAGRVMFAVAPMYTILFLSLFASVFHNEKGQVFTWSNNILLAVTIVFSLILFVHPTYLIPTIELRTVGQNFIAIDHFWYALYNAYFTVAFLITFTTFFLHIMSRRGASRQQLIFVFTGTVLSAAVSLVTNLSLPMFFDVNNLIWIGPTSTLFYIITVSYSIVKHKLFDIKLAAVRTVAYAGALLTLSGVYYVLAYFLSILLFGGHVDQSISVSPINIILALLLAFIFQPIKRFFDRVTNDIFYRDSYSSSKFFADLSRLLTSTTDLHGLLERASTQIATTLKAEQALFFLYYANGSSHHTSAGTHGHAKLPMEDSRLLDKYVTTTNGEIILTDKLPDKEHGVRRMLRSHRIALVMPLRQDDKLTGYVLLGEHLSGNYTKRDLNVLSTINNELIIAIQNAVSLHEVRELNATLQQRINVATKELRSSNAQLKHLDEVKDEFMSMASHQLRTPLTSVKGYISMVLEGDAGKISTQQQKLLVEAYKSSERMVGLIADFLNVSRLQTGKFVIEKSLLDLGEIVRQEVSDLELIASSHSIKLRLNAPKQPLPVMVDESKIRQVIMNLIDNAIYYSHAKSTIVITVEKTGSNVAMTVVDTGIGVPVEEQARLFHKFFRAKNARQQRPDGTGVGLYLARRVVTAHKGSIIFSSKEGKGSTFGFRLPLDTTKQTTPATQSTASTTTK